MLPCLNVSGRRMPNGPDVEDSFEYFLDASLLKESDDGTHPGNVDVNLPVGVAVDVVVPRLKVLLDVARVLVPFPIDNLQMTPRTFAGRHFPAADLRRRQVSAECLPGLGSGLGRDAGPGQFAQLFQLERRRVQEGLELGKLFVFTSVSVFRRRFLRVMLRWQR